MQRRGAPPSARHLRPIRAATSRRRGGRRRAMRRARNPESTMRRIVLASCAALILLGLASPPALANEALFSANLQGNVADQVIAGFPASRATWDIERGRVTLLGFGDRHAIVVAQ